MSDRFDKILPPDFPAGGVSSDPYAQDDEDYYFSKVEWFDLMFLGVVVGRVEEIQGEPLRVSDYCADAGDEAILTALRERYGDGFKLGPWGPGLGEHDSLADVIGPEDK